MNGETLDISTLVAIGGLILTLIALTGGVLYRLGQLSARADQQASDTAELRKDVRELREESRDMREESRRNHQQLLRVLGNHSHDPATGVAVFPNLPPME